MDKLPKLPHWLTERYRVLKYVTKLRIPAFEKQYSEDAYAFTPEPVASEEWYGIFERLLRESVGKRYLPLCRLGDGEFLFWLGPQPPVPKQKTPYRLLRGYAAYCYKRLLGDFLARTPGRYVSGNYTRKQWKSARRKYERDIVYLAERGIISAGFLFGPKVSIYEHYFPAAGKKFRALNLDFTLTNYVPVYFPYALLTGPSFGKMIDGVRLLVITHADDEKRNAVAARLLSLGARSVEWLDVSAEQSLFDRVDIGPFAGKIDLCFVAAGIGKVAILPQLEPLKVPCLDVGYVLEVWADPSAAKGRPYLEPDENLRDRVKT